MTTKKTSWIWFN